MTAFFIAYFTEEPLRSGGGLGGGGRLPPGHNGLAADKSDVIKIVYIIILINFERFGCYNRTRYIPTYVLGRGSAPLGSPLPWESQYLAGKPEVLYFAERTENIRSCVVKFNEIKKKKKICGKTRKFLKILPQLPQSLISLFKKLACH